MAATLERRSLNTRPVSPMATLGGAWRRPALLTDDVDIVETSVQMNAPHTMESTSLPSPDPGHKPGGRILAIDDDPRLLQNFALALESQGYRVETAETLADGLRLAATRPFHVCLLDHNIGYDSGIEALPRLRELAPLMRIIMVTGNAAVDDAVKAIALGASDYLVKPCSPDQLRISVARQVDTRRILDRLDSLEREADAGAPELGSKNKAMQAAIEMALQVAPTDANLLLLGESGTGKGVIAKAVHRASPRAGGALVTVNCPSLSTELMESELFGHSKGSFTGAVQNTVGRVTHADGGTIFLDEVGDFPLPLQPKLLRTRNTNASATRSPARPTRGSSPPPIAIWRRW
jgi:two-component system, NtrC family, response regulator AlgB